MQHDGTDNYCVLNSTLKEISPAKEAGGNQCKAPWLAIQLLLLSEMIEEKVWWMFPISAVHTQELSAVY